MTFQQHMNSWPLSHHSRCSAKQKWTGFETAKGKFMTFRSKESLRNSHHWLQRSTYRALPRRWRFLIALADCPTIGVTNPRRRCIWNSIQVDGQVIYAARAILYHLNHLLKEWVHMSIDFIHIVKQNEAVYRLVMWQETALRIVTNHYVLPVSCVKWEIGKDRVPGVAILGTLEWCLSITSAKFDTPSIARSFMAIFENGEKVSRAYPESGAIEESIIQTGENVEIIGRTESSSMDDFLHDLEELRSCHWGIISHSYSWLLDRKIVLQE